MNILQIIDIGSGNLEISWSVGENLLRSCSPVPFEDPMNAEDYMELSWYLEDYLDFPYGAEKDRAEKLERQMKSWGVCLFQQCFSPDNGNPYLLYQDAIREGLDNCEICITSNNPAFFKIPWEIMYDPAPGRGYISQSLAGFYRHRTGNQKNIPKKDFDLFRVLLVLSRPYGEKDIPMGTVASPVLEALDPLRSNIKLDVLRPPSFEALKNKLYANPGYYQVVHFDGHGIFRNSVGYGDGEGCLAFENEDGSEHIVGSYELGYALANCKVPLFVLNACQSAQEGKKDPYSSVASSLIATGAKGVVAMSYSVYTAAATYFMKEFYKSLVEGASLSCAVANGRKALYATPERKSVVGDLPLQDWMVPTLYQQKFSYIPIPSRLRKEAPDKQYSNLETLEAISPYFGFIGRDYDILRIERQFRNPTSLCVIITAIGGAGKTSLAYGFGKWYMVTGGCPGGVYLTDFKGKASFKQIIGSIMGYSLDLSALTEVEQFELMVQKLREQDCLLIWDNFETVAGFSNQEGLASEEDLNKINLLLESLKGGKSKILITTKKTEERWLNTEYQRLELKGLNFQDSIKLTAMILNKIDKSLKDYNDDSQFYNLLNLLKGHPRSLELILPQLRRNTPTAIIEALQLRIDELGENLEDASLRSAFNSLSPRAQIHLPLIGLFISYIYLQTLYTFVAHLCDHGEKYQEIFGEVLSKEEWKSILEEAAGCGIIYDLGEDVYELHPTLTQFLRMQIANESGQAALQILDYAFVTCYSILADYFFEESFKANQNVLDYISMEENNFLRSLRIAVKDKHWENAYDICRTIYTLYENKGRFEEWRVLRDHLLEKLGNHFAPGDDLQLFSLWMLLANDKATEHLEKNELDKAASIYMLIESCLLSSNFDSETVEHNIAIAYKNLGIVARERMQYDQAEVWCEKAIEILERHHSDEDVAGVYNELGIIEELRMQYNQAEIWYIKAVEIFERFHYEKEAAALYENLGNVAEARLQYDKAYDLNRKALKIYLRLGLEKYAAGVYHELGIIAEARLRYDEAGYWYKNALEIYELLEMEKDIVREYVHLGTLASKQEQYDQDEAWSKKALEISERLDLENYIADVYLHFGIIAQARLQYDEADAWYQRALSIYERLGLEESVCIVYQRMGGIALRGMQYEKAEVTYKKILEIAERPGLEKNRAEAYHNLGILYLKCEKYDQAEVWLNEAINICKRINHLPLLANALSVLGLIRGTQYDFISALYCLGQAYFIAVESENSIVLHVTQHLSIVLKALGEKEFIEAWLTFFPNFKDMEELLKLLR